MSRFSPLIAVITVLLFSPVCYTAYSSTSKANVALYWGQGAGQQRLLHFCQQSTVDIIPIGFVHVFPAQGNGFPGTNFGNQCWGQNNVYQGPGPNPGLNQLQSNCPQIAADVPVCQSTYGKKIILSLGGGSNTYQLTGATEGVAFADFLWGAFGPQTASWLAKGLPRPFDGPGNAAVEVDGFDFDIEYPSTDNAAGYIAMIGRLRSLFSTANKPYLITGAPQCIVADANMGHMISAVQFDILFIQYYNTPQCSARSWVASNPNYLSSGIEQLSGFTYNDWATSLAGTPSANAKLYIGLLGDVSGNYYLSPDETKSLVKAYFCKPNFGGVMIWEATSAENNAAGSYFVAVKNILTNFISDTSLSCYNGPPKSWTVLTLSTATTKTASYDIHLSGIKLVSIPDPIPTSSTTSKPATSPKLTTTSKSISSSTLKQTTSLKLTTSSRSLSSSTSKLATSPKLTTTSKFISIPVAISTSKPATSQKLTTTSKFISSSTSKPTTSLKLTTTSKLSPIPSSTSKPTTSYKLTTTIKLISIPAISSKIVTTITKLTSTSKATPAATPTIVIPAGACGAPYGNSCGPGFCCSQYGYCGAGSAWCGAGCQTAFGICS